MAAMTNIEPVASQEGEVEVTPEMITAGEAILLAEPSVFAGHG
jgi:hypothetical protein